MIVTERLHLRPFARTDAPKLFVMSQEAALRRWLPDQVYRDEQHADEVARALMAYTDAAPDPAVRPYVLGIEERASRALIGHVGLSAARGSVEIGYAIGQQLHGQGLATEAVMAMTSWALAELGLSEVLGIVATDNVGSCRVLEKAGFVRVAEEETRRIYRMSRK